MDHGIKVDRPFQGGLFFREETRNSGLLRLWKWDLSAEWMRLGAHLLLGRAWRSRYTVASCSLPLKELSHERARWISSASRWMNQSANLLRGNRSGSIN